MKQMFMDADEPSYSKQATSHTAVTGLKNVLFHQASSCFCAYHRAGLLRADTVEMLNSLGKRSSIKS